MPLHSSANSACKKSYRSKFAFSASAATLIALVATSAAAYPVFARGHGNAPSVIIGGRAAKFKEAPFISDDGQLYAPVDFVRLMGMDYSVQAAQNTVSITHGLRSMVWPCVMVNGTPMVQVSGVARGFGGDYEWDQSRHIATIRAKILMVREDDDHLTVDTSFPVSYRVAGIDGPSRVYLDVGDASLNGPYTTIPTDGNDDILQVRANQIRDSTVRITVNLRRPLGFETARVEPTEHIDVRLFSDGRSRGVRVTPAAISDSDEQNATSPDASTSGGPDSGAGASSDAPLNPSGISWTLRRAAASRHILSIATDETHPGVFRLSVVLAGDVSSDASQYRAFLLSDPPRLALDFPSADYTLTGDPASNRACEMPLTNAMAKTVRWGIVKSSATLLSRIVLDLYKPLSYNVTAQRQADGTMLYTLTALLNTAPATAPLPKPPDAPPLPNSVQPPLTNPNAVDNTPPTQPVPPPIISEPAPGSSHNTLAGLTIVVDPGHGGYDTGAPGIHGVYEKNIVLAIGKRLRDELVASGARVLMTRDDDTFIPLTGRAAMGVSNGADLFVSVHADSVPVRNQASGTSVYYHANVLSSRRVARSIADRLSQLSDGIPSKGPMSDFVRYPGIGFSVLRHSTEAAVLVETGYVNSDNDEPVLTDSADQKLIAEGIAAGIKDYFANRGGGVAETGSQQRRSVMTAR